MDEKYSVIRSLQFIKNKVGESMKIALVQLSMSKDINANLKKVWNIVIRPEIAICCSFRRFNCLRFFHSMKSRMWTGIA